MCEQDTIILIILQSGIVSAVRHTYNKAVSIGVYGSGRFGSFWAQLLSSQYTVYCTDPHSDIIFPAGVHCCSLEELCKLPFIYLCPPISSFRQSLNDIVSLLQPGTTVIDTCSVKSYPVEQMNSILPQFVNVIATHPLFGPDSGNEFPKTVITHFVRGDYEKYTEVIASLQNLQIQSHEMSPDDHDRLMAYTQGVTHLVGRVLGNIVLPMANEFTPYGYWLMRKVVEQTCNDSLELFRDLQKYNPYTDDMRKDLESSFRAVQKLLKK